MKYINIVVFALLLLFCFYNRIESREKILRIDYMSSVFC